MGGYKKNPLIPVLRLFVFKWACKHFGNFLRILVLGGIDTDPPSGRSGARLQGWRYRSQLTRATRSYTNRCLPTTHPFCFCPKETAKRWLLNGPLPQEWHHTSWNLRPSSLQLTAFSSLFRHWPAPTHGSRHPTRYVSPQNPRPPVCVLSTSSHPIWAS